MTTLRTALPLLVLIACNASLAAGTLRVTGRTDDIQVLANIPVEVTQGPNTYISYTDIDGRTSDYDLDFSTPFMIGIPSSPVDFASHPSQPYTGETIEQRLDINPTIRYPSATQADILYYVPVARAVVVTSASPVISDGLSARWLIQPHSPASAYFFSAHIGYLPDPTIISRYLGYKIGLKRDDFEQAVLIRVDSTADLGSDNLTLSLDMTGHSYGAQDPVPATFYLGSDPLGNGVSATLISTAGNRALLSLEGQLRTGDNLLILKKANSPSRLTHSAYTLGQPTLIAPSSTSCTPDLTGICDGQTDSCTPSTPSGGCEVTLVETTCEVETRTVGGKMCADCGSSVSEQVCEEWEGSIVFNLKLFLFDAEDTLEISASGRVYGKTCMTVAANEGHCAQGYICWEKCVTKWEIDCGYGVNGPISYFTSTSCVVEGTKGSTTCKFADCP